MNQPPTIELNGIKVPLRLTHRWIAQAEWDLKTNIISPGGILENIETAVYFKFAVLIYAGTLHAKPVVEEDIVGAKPGGEPIYRKTARNWTLEEILEMLTPETILTVQDAVSEALRMYVEAVAPAVPPNGVADDDAPLAEMITGSSSGQLVATTSD